MGFKLMEKSRGRLNQALLPMEVSIAKTSISFGKDIMEFFKGKFVEIYMDKEKMLVGFSPTTNELTGYKLTQDKRTTKHASSRISINDNLKGCFSTGRYLAYIDKKENMVIINITQPFGVSRKKKKEAKLEEAKNEKTKIQKRI